MQKFIKNIIRFFLLCVPVYCLLIIIWGEFFQNSAFKKNLNYQTASYGHQYSRIKEVKNVRDVDLLLLGSSHTYRGFDVRNFQKNGWTTFNLGSSSQSHIQTNLLLKRYLKQLRPKLIVYEVCPGLFDNEGIESSLNLIANDDIDRHTLKTALELNHIKVYNALIYGFYCDVFGIKSEIEEPVKKDVDTYISGGYVERELSFHKYTTHENLAFKIKKEQLDAFKNSLQMIAAEGIPFRLLQSPTTRPYYEAYADNSRFDSLMSTFGIYKNFNIKMNFDDSLHYFDAHHLNQWGVEIFNQKVIDWLQSDTLLSL